MLPLSDDVPARRFPGMTLAMIAANVTGRVLYELPDLDGAVTQAGHGSGLAATQTTLRPTSPCWLDDLGWSTDDR